MRLVWHESWFETNTSGCDILDCVVHTPRAPIYLSLIVVMDILCNINLSYILQMLSLRFPAPDKASKMGKLDASLFPQINKPVQQQSEVDEVKTWSQDWCRRVVLDLYIFCLCSYIYFHSLQNLASMLFDALLSLREQIMDECSEGYNAYHIFK